MFAFAGWLFDTTGFVPRKDCGAWDENPGLMWMHVGGDLFIWLAYVSIPLVLLYFTRRRDLPYPGLFVCFALFILACGFGHLIESLMFQYPLYRLAGAWKVVTAVVSWVTVVALIPVIPVVMRAVSDSLNRSGGRWPVNDTALHRLAAPDPHERLRDYIIAVLAGVLAVLLRAAVDPLVGDNALYAWALLAVVFVSWQSGFAPGAVTLVVSMLGTVFFFTPPRYSLVIEGYSNQLVTALFFFCGMCCAALGEAQRAARKTTRLALSEALGRKADLEGEVARRREVEDAVRESEARFRSMADSVPALVWVSDTDRRRTYFNRTWLEFTGRPLEQEAGDGWVENVHPDDRDRYMAAYTTAFAAREAFEVEYRLRRRDGKYRWVLARGTPRFTPSGAFAGFVGLCVDVTDRKKAEEGVRRSEQNLADFFENANVGLHWVNADGVVTRANRAELDMLGYSRDEYVGRPVAEFHDDREAIADILARLRRGEKLDNYPARMRCRDGSTRDVLISSTGLWEDGRFVHSRCFTRDVTELKRAEDKLREGEEKFRTLADGIPQLAWMARPDGRIFWYNRRWYDYTGTTPEQMEGRGWAGVVDPAALPAVAERWKASLATGEPFDMVVPVRGADGRFRPFLTRGLASRDEGGRVVRWFGTNTDITDRREMEQALRDAAQRFRTLTEAVPQMVWTADPRGAATFFNRRWDEYTGRRAELGTDPWAGVVHPDDEDRVRGEWRGAVEAQAERFTAEFRLRRASDGAYRWMLATAVSLLGPGGVVAEWVGSVTDIDDQKRQSETLERTVKERTRALVEEVEERRRVEQQVREVAAELARSNGELEQFAYVASHDLQEPLRKIQAFGDRLKTKVREELPEAGREYVDRMLTSAGRMRRLIDDLLTFSRVTTQARSFAPIDLTALVHEVVGDLSERIDSAGGTVVVHDLPRIDADATQMRQLFQNLIANAVKFQRPGVPPFVEVGGELVTEPLPDPGDEPVPACRITVRDNGIGFDEKYLDRIFQVFQRLHGRDEYEGTGVGLAICRKIVQRHGGAITARSRPGEGTAFVVTLPVRPPYPSDASPPEPAGDRRRREDAPHHD